MQEFAQVAQKSNSQKLDNKKYCGFDEMFFQYFSRFFDKNEKWLKSQLNLYAETFGRFSIYIKEYFNNVKNKVAEKNFLSSEFYKSKIALADKKNKTLMLENNQWVITKDQCRNFGLSLEQVQQSPYLAKKFLFQEETKSIRQYTDFYAYVSYKTY